MAYEIVPVRSVISFKATAGTTPTGKIKYASFSFSNVSSAASAGDYGLFAETIAPLCAETIVEIGVNRYNRLEA